MIVSRPFVGRLVDSYNANVVVYSTIFLYAIGLVVLILPHQISIFLLSASMIFAGQIKDREVTFDRFAGKPIIPGTIAQMTCEV